MLANHSNMYCDVRLSLHLLHKRYECNAANFDVLTNENARYKGNENTDQLYLDVLFNMLLGEILKYPISRGFPKQMSYGGFEIK